MGAPLSPGLQTRPAAKNPLIGGEKADNVKLSKNVRFYHSLNTAGFPGFVTRNFLLQ